MARRLADTQAIALFTRRAPSTIRNWAHRGWLQRRGTDRKGRALYAIDEAETLVARLNIDKPPDVRQHLKCSTRGVS